MKNPKLTFIFKEPRGGKTAVNSHSHTSYELVFFHKADGSLFVGENSYPLQSGTIYVVYPNTLHSEEHYSSGNVTFLGFECDNFPKEISNGIPYNFHMHKRISDLIETILNETREQNEFYSEIISHKLSEIILLLKRYSSLAEQAPKKLDYSLAYISEYYNQPIDFCRLAKISGYSLDRFRHIFTENIGMSPKQFQINIRLEKAGELLADTNKSCTEIASFCGFSTSAQFSKMFVKKYGLPPSKFRKEQAHAADTKK